MPEGSKKSFFKSVTLRSTATFSPPHLGGNCGSPPAQSGLVLPPFVSRWDRSRVNFFLFSKQLYFSFIISLCMCVCTGDEVVNPPVYIQIPVCIWSHQIYGTHNREFKFLFELFTKAYNSMSLIIAMFCSLHFEVSLFYIYIFIILLFFI